MRLGAYECALVPGTLAGRCYGTASVFERHRHRFEFNKRYESAFEEVGVVFSGRWPEKNLVEIMELPDHPWFLGCQFHPEFRSRPGKPHPLFFGFVEAALGLAIRREREGASNPARSRPDDCPEPGTVEVGERA